MSFSYSKLTVAVAACLAGSVAMAADVEIYGKVDLALNTPMFQATSPVTAIASR